jgi:hypothetical protein
MHRAFLDSRPSICEGREETSLSVGANAESGWRTRLEGNWVQRSHTRASVQEWE